MTLSENPFIGTPLIKLVEMRDAFLQAILDVATTGKNYQINGRTFTAEDLAQMRETLFGLNQAIRAAGGAIRTEATPVFPGGNSYGLPGAVPSE